MTPSSSTTNLDEAGNASEPIAIPRSSNKGKGKEVVRDLALSAARTPETLDQRLRAELAGFFGENFVPPPPQTAEQVGEDGAREGNGTGTGPTGTGNASSNSNATVASLATLPVELVLLVLDFARFDQRTLHSLSLVCRKINWIVTPLLYKGPNLQSTMVWAQLSQTLCKAKTYHSRLALMLTHLDLGSSENAAKMTTGGRYSPRLNMMVDDTDDGPNGGAPLPFYYGTNGNRQLLSTTYRSYISGNSGGSSSSSRNNSGTAVSGTLSALTYRLNFASSYAGLTTPTNNGSSSSSSGAYGSFANGLEPNSASSTSSSTSTPGSGNATGPWASYSSGFRNPRRFFRTDNDQGLPAPGSTGAGPSSSTSGGPLAPPPSSTGPGRNVRFRVLSSAGYTGQASSASSSTGSNSAAATGTHASDQALASATALGIEFDDLAYSPPGNPFGQNAPPWISRFSRRTPLTRPGYGGNSYPYGNANNNNNNGGSSSNASGSGGGGGFGNYNNGSNNSFLSLSNISTQFVPWSGVDANDSDEEFAPEIQAGLLGFYSPITATAPAATASASTNSPTSANNTANSNANASASATETSTTAEPKKQRAWPRKRGHVFLSVTSSSLLEVSKRAHGIKTLNLSNSTMAPDSEFLERVEQVSIGRLQMTPSFQFLTAYIPETDDYVSRLYNSPHSYMTRIPISILDAFRALAENCPDLEAINLRNCDFVSDDLVQLLVCNLPNLRYLDLTGCTRVAAAAAMLWDCENETEAVTATATATAPQSQESGEMVVAPTADAEEEQTGQGSRSKLRSPLADRVVPKLGGPKK